MIYNADSSSVEKAAEILKNGGLVAFPTETVYGLGADALNPAACAEIFAVKKRPFFDPLIVHISEFSQLTPLVKNPSEIELILAHAFWPGPLTIVFRKMDIIPDIVSSGLDTVAVRMPDHPVALELISKTGRPLAAPSANPFGYLSPTEARHVESQLGSSIGMVLDGGSCAVGVESTIIRVEENRIILLRPGGVPAEQIERLSGLRIVGPENSKKIESPGQMPWHYAPSSKLVIIPEGSPVPESAGNALCAFRKSREGFSSVEVLSPEGNLTEATARLFSVLRELDASGAKTIYAEEVPENGLGRAIMNRLKKAAAK
jgi:L-threonylcarbamoyladenylate synthase